MKILLVGGSLLMLCGLAQAGIVQDFLYDECTNSITVTSPGKYCTLQNDGGKHRDASDDCASPRTTASAETGKSFEGVLFALEDESDWYDATVAAAGDVGIRVDEALTTSPWMDIELLVYETDCSTDAVGAGTAGSGTRISATEYHLIGATAGQDFRLGIVVTAYGTSAGGAVGGHVGIATDCDPFCATALDSTVYEFIEYVVQFFSV